MFKKIFHIMMIVLFIASCSETRNSIKRGLTGAKANTADEFLVKKKDPLILPPDFENLPTPDETDLPEENVKIFEKNLETPIEENSTGSSSVEQSILKKIRTK